LPIQIDGIKPLSHFSFLDEQANAMKAYFIQLMLEKGFLASNLYYAMHAHTEEYVEAYMEAVDEAFAGISNSLAHNKILNDWQGHPARAGFKRLT
jgi:glutamate-1-semialdehyde 2,1-aminomutase